MELAQQSSGSGPIGVVLEPNAATRAAVTDALESLGVRCRFANSVEACAATLSETTAAGENAGPVLIVADYGEAVTARPALLDVIEDRVYTPPIVVTFAPATDPVNSGLLSRSVWGVLTKPTTSGDATQVLLSGVAEGRRRLGDRWLVQDYRSREARLSDAEREVLAAVCEGKLNKQMARELGVSVRTIEQRRRRVFATMGVSSAAPLAERVATVRTLERLRPARRPPSRTAAGPITPTPLASLLASPVATV